MKIFTRGEAMRIHQQHPASRLFPFCILTCCQYSFASMLKDRKLSDKM